MTPNKKLKKVNQLFENFLGGKITNFSKTINPNIKISLPHNLDIDYLKFNKMLPRLDKHYSGATENYLYFYLNPFKPASYVDEYHYKIPPEYFGASSIYFGYEPIYVGKGISSTGHRMNQHIADFISGNEVDNLGFKQKNLQKSNKLREISSQFGKPSDDPYWIMPVDWSKYKNDWVILAFNFDSREKLELAEKILIGSIGSINGIKRGPLTNISLTK